MSYMQTVLPSLPLATEIKNIIYGAKLIFHVHELEIVLKHHLENERNLFHDVNRFIAVSDMVKTNLIENWGVNHKSIDVVYAFSEIQMPSEPKKKLKNLLLVERAQYKVARVRIFFCM